MSDIDRKPIEPNRTLLDLLPYQPHYFLLNDGERYARHGTETSNGVLVFTTAEKADEFVRTVGAALPQFRPVRVSAEDMLDIIDEAGSVCTADGLIVRVGKIQIKRHKPEGD